MPASEKNNWLWVAAKIAVTGALLVYVLTRLDWGEVSRLVWAMDAYLGLAALALLALSVLPASGRWQCLLSTHGLKHPFERLFRINMVAIFFNNVLPGVTGGDVYRAYQVMRGSDRKTTALVAVMVDRVIGVTTLALLGVVALLPRLEDPSFREAAWVLIAFLALLGGACAVFLSPLWGRIRAWPALAKLPGYGFLREGDEALRVYAAKPKVVVVGFGLTVIVHLLTVAATFLLSRALGGDWGQVDYSMFLVVLPAVFIISALPISVSGWGVGEALFVFFFAKFGVAAEAAVTLSIMNRLAFVALGLVGGLILLLLPPQLQTEKPPQ